MIVEFLLGILYWMIPVLLGLISVLVIYARWHYGSLENTKGLTGVVTPYFLGGSDPYFYKKTVLLEDSKNAKKYGPIFGYYDGRQPMIFISDPELIRLIFIKDFNFFHNRRTMDLGHPLINEMMDVLPYEKWKVIRPLVTPQLTISKLRGMSYQMLETINEWSLKIGEKLDSDGVYKFDPKEVFTALATSVIARCAFGTKIDAINDPNSVFVKYIKKISFQDLEVGPAMSVVLTFPFLMKILPIFPKVVVDYFGTLLKSILSSRRKQEKAQDLVDFVDVLNDMIDKCKSPEFKEKGITEITVMSQAVIFLIAGFETTANTLTVLSYELAKNPEVQEKLLKEIDSYFDKHDGKINHDTIGELTYLSACMNETLRKNPPVTRIERVCQKDWFHESSGLTIKKNMFIEVPVHAVHFDEKNFPEPDKFLPERFLPENKDKLNPYAFMAFGLGPRNCIGMRFAKEEILMAMASILKEYRIECCEDSKLKLMPGRSALISYEPFHLKLRKRN